MIKQVDWKDAVGKTVKAVRHQYGERNVQFVFTDATFVNVHVETDYDGGFDLEDRQFSTQGEPIDSLEQAGLITPEEAVTMRAERAASLAAQTARQAQEKRNLYERLKKEFGG